MEQVAIKSWGNSQGVRLSKSILDQAGLEVSDLLEITTSPNMIVLKKSFRHKSFEERLAEYNGQISVCDFAWGEPVGKEL